MSSSQIEVVTPLVARYTFLKVWRKWFYDREGGGRVFHEKTGVHGVCHTTPGTHYLGLDVGVDPFVKGCE